MRNNVKYFTFLFIFFIVIAIGSLFVLNGSASVFDRSAGTFGADEAILQNIVIGTEAESDTIMEEAAQYDSGDNNDFVQADVEPEVTTEPEPAMEEVVEPEPEPVTEPETVAEPEPEAQEEVPQEPEDGKRYFTYEVSTKVNALRLRSDTSIESGILANLPKNSKGYIIKPGNSWCKVYTEKGKTGYVSTDYLLITEVTKDDFPAEVQEMVEETTDTLSSAFEGNG